MVRPGPQGKNAIKVWDPVVRLFHWSTLGLFVAAYYTAEWGSNETHVLVGYGLTLVLMVRLIWGLVGTEFARFSRFAYGPRAIVRYWHSLRRGQPEHYLGHNPLGAAMVFLLLGLLGFMALSGLLLTAALEFEGPLLGLNPWITDAMAYRLLDLHRWVVYLMLGCIGLHLLGVLSASVQHHENLVRAMITGYKPRPPAPDIRSPES
ncbi:MAG: cytochrome b/b6 domain-containing protein [Pseudomonadota bacterium]|nr:cytochrome B [Pseudomonadales bacterium]MDY6921459.1 cytochrome b/b6 domain-containing protein [Pseudomonadota bacterium]